MAYHVGFLFSITALLLSLWFWFFFSLWFWLWFFFPLWLWFFFSPHLRLFFSLWFWLFFSLHLRLFFSRCLGGFGPFGLLASLGFFVPFCVFVTLYFLTSPHVFRTPDRIAPRFIASEFFTTPEFISSPSFLDSGPFFMHAQLFRRGTPTHSPSSQVNIDSPDTKNILSPACRA